MKEVLREFSMVPDNAVYVGDSPIDIISSRASGIRVVAAGWAPTTDVNLLQANDPDFLFTSVEEFYTFIERNLGA